MGFQCSGNDHVIVWITDNASTIREVSDKRKRLAKGLEKLADIISSEAGVTPVAKPQA